MSDGLLPPPDPTDAARAADFGPPPGGMEPADILAAEQAGTAYWREVAHQRRIEAAAVQRRPIVRVAVALDRRTRHLQDDLARIGSRIRDLGRRTSVVAPGLSRRLRTLGRPDLAGAVPDTPEASPAVDSILVVQIVEDHRLPMAESEHPSPMIELVQVSMGDTMAEDVNHLVARSDASRVAVLGPAARPAKDWTWLDHLARVIGEQVVASTPRTVHPRRAWKAATAHDLLVRTDGIDLRLDGGVPRATARGAGSRPDRVTPPHVVAAGVTALLVDRTAWVAVGGLFADPPDRAKEPEQDAEQFDGHLVDLSIRLQGGGGRILAVPAAVLVDDRPVRDRLSLEVPVDPDGPTWRTVVERHGPALVRAAMPRKPTAVQPITMALTTATPSMKMAPRSGDWHFGQDLAGALRLSGIEVRCQTAEEADSLAGRACDIHLVLRGLEPVARTPGQRHVLWIISHPEAIELAECDEADLVLVASERFAAHLASRTSTPVEVLHQATDPSRFRPLPGAPANRGRVTVVANARNGERASVADALAAGLRPAVYGQGWEGRIDPELIAGTYVAPADLPTVYASAAVVLNDHWDTMRRWGFVSNRIFDVLACATPVVSDHIPEIVDLFGPLVPTWRDPGELRDIVDHLLADPKDAAAAAAEGRQRVLDAHTFDHRVIELRQLLERHDLLDEHAPR